MEKTIKGKLEWRGKEDGGYFLGAISVNNDILADFEEEDIEQFPEDLRIREFPEDTKP